MNKRIPWISRTDTLSRRALLRRAGTGALATVGCGLGLFPSRDAHGKPLTEYRQARYIMGTVVEIAVAAADQQIAGRAMAYGFQALQHTTWRVIWSVTMDYAGINTSKICSQLCPWASSCSTSWSRFFNASRAIVRTFCPMVTSPCANANLSVSDPEAGALWSNDCATQLKRKWRLTASSLRT